MANPTQFLCNIIISNDVEKLQNELSNPESTLDVNQIIQDGFKFLHLAVHNKSAKIVELFIKIGVNVNLRYENGDSFLHLTAKIGNLDLAKLFVESIDNDAVNNFKNTPLHVAVINNKRDIVLLLLRKSANVNAQNLYGLTPLHLAIETKNIPLIELLLRHGANPNVQDCKEKSSFFYYFHKCDSVTNYLVYLFLNNGAQFEKILDSLVTYFEKVRLIRQLTSRTCFEESAQSECPVLANYEKKIEIFLQHLALLSCQNWNIQENEMEIIESKEWLLTKYNSYCHELVTMQKTKFSTDSNNTFYHLLSKRNNALVDFLRCEIVNQVMSSGDYKKLFIHFSDHLESKYLYGIKLLQNVNEFMKVLSQIFSSIFPRKVINKISEFYNDEDFGICLSRNLCYYTDT